MVPKCSMFDNKGSLGMLKNLGFWNIFFDCSGIFWIFGQISRLLVKIS